MLLRESAVRVVLFISAALVTEIPGNVTGMYNNVPSFSVGMNSVPNRIADWPGAFDYGQTVSQTIRAKSGAQKEALARFARGEANPGQGKGS